MLYIGNQTYSEEKARTDRGIQGNPWRTCLLLLYSVMKMYRDCIAVKTVLTLYKNAVKMVYRRCRKWKTGKIE